jgi:hypothetical protein
MVGGMFSASALYPLEVLKTRMQAESKPTSNPQEETETSSNNTTSSNNGGGGDEAAEKEKQTLKHQYSLAATEGMASYASLMYQHEGGIPPFYAGVGTPFIMQQQQMDIVLFILQSRARMSGTTLLLL